MVFKIVRYSYVLFVSTPRLFPEGLVFIYLLTFKYLHLISVYLLTFKYHCFTNFDQILTKHLRRDRFIFLCGAPCIYLALEECQRLRKMILVKKLFRQIAFLCPPPFWAQQRVASLLEGTGVPKFSFLFTIVILFTYSKIYLRCLNWNIIYPELEWCFYSFSHLKTLRKLMSTIQIDKNKGLKANMSEIIMIGTF